MLVLVAWLGGVLTILSPCILPVLPFVLARSDRRFASNGLPMLLGMAAAFVVVGTLAAVVGEWAVTANRIGRIIALCFLGLFGLALLLPQLAQRLAAPLVALGNRLTPDTTADGHTGFAGSLLLGIATGLLWAPCAGPILGLIFGAAALQGASVHTSLLLGAYALGAATSLALALLAGHRVFLALKSSLGASEGLRRALGAAVVVAVVAILLGVDTGFLARVSTSGTNRIEQALLERAGIGGPAGSVAMGGSMAMSGNLSDGAGMAMSGGAMAMNAGAMSAGAMSAAGAAGRGAGSALPVLALQPSLAGTGPWINSAPLTLAGLAGKVVLVDFWTYSCINCVRAIPYVRAWAQKYRDAGLVVIGVHTPEFAFEKLPANVERAVHDMHIDYPVVLDNDYSIWRAFDNHYWPAHYFIDARGRVRHSHFGEGDYDQSERVIQQLLAENGKPVPQGVLATVAATGAEAASNPLQVQSPETYVGYERGENFVSPGGVSRDQPHQYADGDPRLNEWGLDGRWTIGAESATSGSAPASIAYTFQARDLHLVLGPAEAGKPVRFRVTLDGAPPGQDHGVDVDEQGNGTIDGQRLYQLIRQKDGARERHFRIQFLDAGAQAYAFTFG